MANEAAFQWDPNADQTYNGDDLTLSGTPESFKKVAGKSFTMDAAFSTLILQVPQPGDTIWGFGDSDEPTTILVRNGNLVYECTSAWAVLSFEGGMLPAVKLTVENSATFTARKTPDASALVVYTGDVFVLTLKDAAVAEFFCDTFGLSQDEEDFAEINISGMARMRVVSQSVFGLINATVYVNSNSGGSTYSLNWMTRCLDPQQGMILYTSSIRLAGASTGLLAGPFLTLQGDSRIEVVDTVTLQLMFDSVSVEQGSQFILGGGAAQVKFEGFGNGQPFDFFNTVYPSGMFEITSQGSINRGEFIIFSMGPSPISRILSKGLISIDGVPQYNTSRISCAYESHGVYIVIRQTRV
ncbi:hypothetical protein [Brucella sp. IR073]|uniref:hypothetical protein n=1 Tax=unclassified Brucella TaxID=2632610 RepID=UPI003B983D24